MGKLLDLVLSIRDRISSLLSRGLSETDWESAVCGLIISYKAESFINVG